MISIDAQPIKVTEFASRFDRLTFCRSCELSRRAQSVCCSWHVARTCSSPSSSLRRQRSASTFLSCRLRSCTSRRPCWRAFSTSRRLARRSHASLSTPAFCSSSTAQHSHTAFVCIAIHRTAVETCSRFKYVRPRNRWMEMYAGRVACCPLVSYVEYATRALLTLMLEKDGIDRRTDGRTGES